MLNEQMINNSNRIILITIWRLGNVFFNFLLDEALFYDQLLLFFLNVRANAQKILNSIEIYTKMH